MQRITSVTPDAATGRTAELYQAVEKSLGAVPNTVQVMGNSVPVLESFVAFNSAMSSSGLGSRLHNQVKLATSESNACEYCTSILSAVAPAAGLAPDDIVAGRTASAEDSQTDAALKFAKAVLEQQGQVTDQQLQDVRDAGFSDEAIVEIVGSVVLGCFTNFLNNVADTELDFPAAEPAAGCATGACHVTATATS